MIHKHPYHSIYKRSLYSFILISTIMIFGTIGMHLIEKMPYLDAFYFMSMVATAQGPTLTPATSLGKIFVAIMSFVSVGTAVTALGFLFGPFLGQVWRIGGMKLEQEIEMIKKTSPKKDD